MVIPGARVRLEGIYGYFLIHRLQLCIFGVFLVIFGKESIGFCTISHFLDLV